MLTFLKIGNIALIDALEIEFGGGLNLLTGETGSGKSIVVDSLAALAGERISSDLIKEGHESAQIQGVFLIESSEQLRRLLADGGIDIVDEGDTELLIRRELSRSGKNRIFVNNQLVTQAFLKDVGEFLVDIHGQGEHTALFKSGTHLEMLDDFASARKLRESVAEVYHRWTNTKTELQSLEQDEADKLQLLDILQFQAGEIENANIRPGEYEELEGEKRRLNNVEKLTLLSDDAYKLLYDDDTSTVTTLDKATKKIEELSAYDVRFSEYRDGIASARAVIEDLAITARDFRHRLEFSPERLAEIEDRLAEITHITRKYGGTIASTLDHLADAKQRLENIETVEFREAELRQKIADQRAEYLFRARELNEKRTVAARKFEKEVTMNLKAVALEKAVFEVHIDSPSAENFADAAIERNFFPKGYDRVQFFFSANPGESPKPLARVASGGEASRLMLILKTTAKDGDMEKSAVFDEIDAGIGGRVAQAVGKKLQVLAESQQVLCVTHQPQIASLADRHFVIEKQMDKKRTEIFVRELNGDERVEEIARMLAGDKITEAARQNAREMLGVNEAATGAS